MQECHRLIKNTGFLAFFCQMPTMIDWVRIARKYFKYKEHIIWVTRILKPNFRLSRGHQSIFIFGKNNSYFYETKGSYEDVKVPLLGVDAVSLKTIQKYINELWYLVETGNQPKVQKGGCSYLVDKRFSKIVIISPARKVNYTNVWSFLPENSKHISLEKRDLGHPTQKPFELCKRLSELLTKEEEIMVDPFCGGGNICLAAKALNRKFIGIDIVNEYCLMARNKLKEAEKNVEISVST